MIHMRIEPTWKYVLLCISSLKAGSVYTQYRTKSHLLFIQRKMCLFSKSIFVSYVDLQGDEINY